MFLNVSWTADSVYPNAEKGRENNRITYLSLGAPGAVSRRHADGAEAVDGDAEDGVNGAETGGVVERQPQVAEYLTERPRLVGQDVHRVQRHWDWAYTVATM